jgi:hypothetical protein
MDIESHPRREDTRAPKRARKEKRRNIMTAAVQHLIHLDHLYLTDDIRKRNGNESMIDVIEMGIQAVTNLPSHTMVLPNRNNIIQ